MDKLTSNHTHYPDFIEISQKGVKVHIALNFDDPIGCRDRIDESLSIKSYAVQTYLKYRDPILEKKIEKEINK